MSKAAFFCKAKPDGDTDVSDIGLVDGCIFYGLCSIPDLLDSGLTKADIKAKVEFTYPHFPTADLDANMFWKFSRAMQIGDLVLMPQKQKNVTVYFIGRVLDEAFYAPEHIENYTAYRRAVHWLNNKIPLAKADLSTSLFNDLTRHPYVMPTLSDISEYSEELAKLVDPSTDTTLDAESPFNEFQDSFEARLAASMRRSSKERKKRIAAAPVRSEVPQRRVVRYEYVRNADVVAEALHRANGICEKCGDPAPFIRRLNGMPYLEVHHIVQLAHKGKDVLENTIAICPNCHREEHYGPKSIPA